MSAKKVQAWHFIRENRRLRWGHHGVVKPGKLLKVAGPPILCERGLHASRRLIDALRYAPGPVVCRVELSGEILEDSDKLVATERRVIWMADATHTLHSFACWCAENALALTSVKPDERSVAAIKTKRLWLQGKATDKELAAVRAAARAVAWAAVRAVAWDAAGDAAGAAAGAAAGNAVRAAVRAAAGAAVGAAVGAAARADVRAAQNRQLARMVNAIRVKERA